MFKPYGEVTENFEKRKYLFACVNLDNNGNAKKE